MTYLFLNYIHITTQSSVRDHILLTRDINQSITVAMNAGLTMSASNMLSAIKGWHDAAS
nr:MAG TPA_asm: hypothetical protein [Caudoviricetes sp.]